jgi:hypothetical protein
MNRFEGRVETARSAESEIALKEEAVYRRQAT